MKAEKPSTPSKALSAALQWACSPRGGNNFYGRVLNGCARRASDTVKTAAVGLDPVGRYVFSWNPEWFHAQPEAKQLLVVVHEAAHLVLQHVERGIRILANYPDVISVRLLPVLQVAADMACNDTALRPMMGDTNLKFSEFKKDCIWPESMKFARGETMEQYFLRLLSELRKNDWDPDPEKSKSHLKGNSPGSCDQCDSDSDSGQKEKKESKSGTDGEKEENGKEKQQNAGGQGEESSDKQQQGGGGSGQSEENKDGQPQGGGGGGDNPHGYPQWFQNLLNSAPQQGDWMEGLDRANPGQIERALRRAKRESRNIVRTAVRQTQKSRGTIPGNMQDILDEILAEPTIPWTTVLFGIIKHEITSKLDESTAYPNVGLLHSDEYEPYPGYQNAFTFRIVAAFDTSGSMSDEEVKEAYTELLGILDTEDGVKIRLIHFDHGLQHEEDLDEDSVPRLRQGAARYGHGGTSFTHPLRYVLHRDTEDDWVAKAKRVDEPLGVVDLFLLFTDGEAPIPFPELKPDMPFWWVLTTNGREDSRMERILHIT